MPNQLSVIALLCGYFIINCNTECLYLPIQVSKIYYQKLTDEILMKITFLLLVEIKQLIGL